MFAEIGWQQHKMSHEREVGSGDVDFGCREGPSTSVSCSEIEDASSDAIARRDPTP